MCRADAPTGYEWMFCVPPKPSTDEPSATRPCPNGLNRETEPAPCDKPDREPAKPSLTEEMIDRARSSPIIGSLARMVGEVGREVRREVQLSADRWIQSSILRATTDPEMPDASVFEKLTALQRTASSEHGDPARRGDRESVKLTGMGLASLHLELPSIPEKLALILEILTQNGNTATALAEALGRDAATSSKLMGIANSRQSWLRRSIGSVSDLMSELGVQETALLALAVAAHATVYCAPSRNDDGAGCQLGRHALANAVTARLIAQQGEIDPREAFVAGLLHDLGDLLVLSMATSEGAPIADAVRPSPRLTTELRRVLHGHLAAAIAHAWGFSPTIVAALRDHHESAGDSPTSLDGPPAPPLDTPAQQLAVTVHVADRIAALLTTEAQTPSCDVHTTQLLERLSIGFPAELATAAQEIFEVFDRELAHPGSRPPVRTPAPLLAALSATPTASANRAAPEDAVHGDTHHRHATQDDPVALQTSPPPSSPIEIEDPSASVEWQPPPVTAQKTRAPTEPTLDPTPPPMERSVELLPELSPPPVAPGPPDENAPEETAFFMGLDDV